MSRQHIAYPGSSSTTTGVSETAQRPYIHNVDGTGLGFLAKPQAIH